MRTTLSSRSDVLILLFAMVLIFSLWADLASAQTFRLSPEQRRLQIRQPEQLSPTPMPSTTVPFTVTTKENRIEQKLSLDEAIRVAIQNADVIRVLGGVTAGSSGRTIYDVALSNTGIDQSLAVFDPVIDVNSTMNKTDRPGAAFDPGDPTQAIFVGSSTDSINTTVGLSKQNLNGATVGLNASAIGSFFEPGVFPLERFRISVFRRIDAASAIGTRVRSRRKSCPCYHFEN